ncbi:MAG: dienelactone hydrolase family protein [Balneolaceae bacterium]|jgi:phospholipase/carboxylesterase
MPLFRVDPQKPFTGPHQNQPIFTAGTDVRSAQMAMILIHGRGASAQSMLRLSEEFEREDIHYRALRAEGNTWYPRSFMAPLDMNEPGISSGIQAIYDCIGDLNQAGITTDHMILLGFSQGACLATEFAARHPRRYGGIVGFSGGLIGEMVDPGNYEGSLDETPVFLGCSDNDPHIPEERVETTALVFRTLTADVTKRIYQGMGHTVNQDELRFVSNLINQLSD